MNDKDLHKLIAQLGSTQAAMPATPGHQRRLRAGLLAAHSQYAAQQTTSRHTLGALQLYQQLTQGVRTTMKKNIVTAGAATLAVSALNEAQRDNDLRVLPTSEYKTWGAATAKEDPAVKTYLTYTKANGHRMVIALDASNQPVYITDFGCGGKR